MGLNGWKLAEQSVIGALLIDPDEVAGMIFQSARAEFFEDAALRHLFEAALRIWERNRPLDAVTVLAEAGGDYETRARECMEMTPTCANTGEYLRILRSSARTAKLQSEALRIASAETEDEAVAAYEAMGRMMTGTEDIEDLSVTELISDYLDRMRDKKPVDYLSFGIDKLDELLYITPGKFVIIAGDASSGKTALSLQFAWHMAEHGRRVGFFSLETDKESLTDRLMAERQVAGIPLPTTKQKKLTDLHFEAAGLAGMKSDGVPMRIIRRATTVNQIRARTIMRRFDVIFVDYVQLINMEGKDRYTKVTEISMALHRMAQDLGVTVIGLSQITQAGDGSNKSAPSSDDLRESRQLKQDADAIMILGPDPNGAQNLRWLHVTKNKDGRKAKLQLLFEPEYMSFSYQMPVEALRSDGKATKQKNRADGIARAKQAEAVKFEELPEGQEDLPF